MPRNGIQRANPSLSLSPPYKIKKKFFFFYLDIPLLRCLQEIMPRNGIQLVSSHLYPDVKSALEGGYGRGKGKEKS
jgi:hypothetical protein